MSMSVLNTNQKFKTNLKGIPWRSGGQTQLCNEPAFGNLNWTLKIGLPTHTSRMQRLCTHSHWGTIRIVCQEQTQWLQPSPSSRASIFCSLLCAFPAANHNYILHPGPRSGWVCSAISLCLCTSSLELHLPLWFATRKCPSPKWKMKALRTT